MRCVHSNLQNKTTTARELFPNSIDPGQCRHCMVLMPIGASRPARPAMETGAARGSAIMLSRHYSWYSRGITGTAETAMEMHEIRYFLAVCETLNFTRA